MKVTIKDIARHVHVSKTLVSLYLNNHPLSAKISPKTKTRIDDAVRELGYRPSFAARALAKGRTGTIGMIIAAIRDPFSYYLVDLAMKEINERDAQLLLMVTNTNEEALVRCLERLLENQVDGVLSTVPLPVDTPQYKELKERHFPLVSINLEQPDFSCVYNDFAPAVEEAVTYIKSLGAETLHLYSNGNNATAQLLRKSARSHALKLARTLSLVNEADLEDICKSVLKNRPQFLFFTNCRAARVLVNEIHRAGIDYQPEIFTVYTLPSDIIDDPRIAGAIQYNFKPLVTNGLELLDHLLKAPGKAEREEIVLSTRFLRRDQFGELESLGRYNYRTS